MPLPEHADRFVLHCADPAGQIFHLALGVFWFFGQPEPDFTQAEINGDAVHGTEVAKRHVDCLRCALAAALAQNSHDTHGGRAT